MTVSVLKATDGTSEAEVLSTARSRCCCLAQGEAREAQGDGDVLTVTLSETSVDCSDCMHYSVRNLCKQRGSKTTSLFCAVFVLDHFYGLLESV